MSEAGRPAKEKNLCDSNQRLSRAWCRNGSLYCASAAGKKTPGGIDPKRCHRMERCVTMAAFREEFDRVPDNTVEK